MIRLSVGIQHHPERAALLGALLASLEGCETEVVTDPQPDGARSAWRGYRHVLETTPEWATHRLVIQDDALPCRNFPQVVERAINARPERLLCLCVCGNAVASVHKIYTAGRNQIPWVVLTNTVFWIPVVAIVWPVHLIKPGLEFVDAQGWPDTFNADDEIAGRIAHHLGEYVLATVPSIVEHDDMQPSITGKTARYGHDPGRVTACPPPDDCDLTQIDWTLGPA